MTDAITWSDLCALRDPLAIYCWIQRALQGTAQITGMPLVPKTRDLDLVERTIACTPENEAKLRGTG